MLRQLYLVVLTAIILQAKLKTVSAVSFPHTSELIDVPFGDKIRSYVSRNASLTYYFQAEINQRNFRNFIEVATSVHSASFRRPVKFEIEFYNYFDPTFTKHWTLPDINSNSRKLSLCACNFDNPELPNNITLAVTVSTHSVEPVSFSILAFLPNTILSELNQSSQGFLTYSSPAFFQLLLANTTPSGYVELKINSTEDLCTTVSFQRAACPLLTSFNDNSSRVIKYWTLSNRSLVLLDSQDLKNGGILQFLMHKDNRECKSDFTVSDDEKGDNLNKLFKRVSISMKFQDADYVFPILLTGLLMFIIFGFVMYLNRTRVPDCIKRYIMVIVSQTETEESQHLLAVVNEDNTQREVNTSTETVETAENNETEKEFLLLVFIKQDTCGSGTLNESENQKGLTPPDFMYVIMLLGHAVWNLVQFCVNRQGGANEDSCYLNYECIRPLFGLLAFNHVLANSWYTFWGLVFLLIVQTNREYFILDVFAAMGFGLTMIGFSFCLYQTCPQSTAFQFDASFVYLTALWCIVVLCPFRRPGETSDSGLIKWGNIELVFSWVVYLALNGTRWFWVVMTLAHLIICAVLSLHIDAYLNNKAWVLDIKTNRTLTQACLSIYQPFIRMNKELIVYNVINCIPVLIALPLINQQKLAEICVGYIMLQLYLAMIICIIKFVQKAREGGLRKEQKEELIKAILFFVLAVLAVAMPAIIATTAIPFSSVDTRLTWTVLTPAESRLLNDECAVFNFFDRHDIFHFFISLSLFMQLMMVFSISKIRSCQRKDDSKQPTVEESNGYLSTQNT